MNERMKILQLLEDGKITAEQAAQLLSAIEERREEDKSRTFQWSFPKKSNDEWKAMTNQIKSTLSQHLDEWKKNIDIEDWAFKSAPRVAATLDKTLPAEAIHLVVDAKNGRIQANAWDGDAVRIQVRSYIKADNAESARQALDTACQLSGFHDRYEFTVNGTKETGETSVELLIPRTVKSIRLKSHNGDIRIHHIIVDEFNAETHNGSLVTFQTQAERMRLSTHNGNIDIQHAVEKMCRSVYATTQNGTIDIDGIAVDAHVSGTAKSHHGRVDVTGENLQVEYDHPQNRQHARFRTVHEDASASPETQVFCETKHGNVVLRG